MEILRVGVSNPSLETIPPSNSHIIIQTPLDTAAHAFAKSDEGLVVENFLGFTNVAGDGHVHFRQDMDFLLIESGGLQCGIAQAGYISGNGGYLHVGVFHRDTKIFLQAFAHRIDDFKHRIGFFISQPEDVLLGFRLMTREEQAEHETVNIAHATLIESVANNRKFAFSNHAEEKRLAWRLVGPVEPWRANNDDFRHGVLCNISAEHQLHPVLGAAIAHIGLIRRTLGKQTVRCGIAAKGELDDMTTMRLTRAAAAARKSCCVPCTLIC